MATYDDRQWLLSHIQNSYVTSDDTGLCELVVQVEPGAAPVVEFPCLADTDSPPHYQEDPPPHSLDIASANTTRGDYMDFVGHRQRSYTAQRLEIMRREKKNASKVKRITWKHNQSQITESELNDLFTRKTVISSGPSLDSSDAPPQASVSLLTRLMQQFPQGLDNPFIEYAKFDGSTHTNVQARRISIYLLVGDNPKPTYPMVVSVVNSSQARVIDLIGLICWLYTKENRQPPLRGGVDRYALHIAEEDGQVDWDFAALRNRDVIEKFGFNILALVEKKDVSESSQDIVVTLNIAGGAFSKITVENYDITLKEILSRMVAKRKDMMKIIEAGLDYHLEKEDEPGIALDADKTLADINCTEFAVVRDNSKRIDLPPDDNNMSTVEATLYRSYKVTWLLKFGKCEACIGISGDKLEIQPLQQKVGGAFLPLRSPHAVTYNMELVVDCCRKAEKKGKMEIQVTCLGENRFKDYVFECQAKIGQEILDKCRHIFDLRASSARKEFWREKKPFRRHNSLSMRRRPRAENHVNEV